MGIFTDKDSGWKDMISKFEANAGESSVFCGYLRSSGTYKNEKERKSDAKASKKKIEAASPITMAALAAVHEFGADIRNGFGKGVHIVIPERSFMRSTMNTKANELTKLTKRLANAVLKGKMGRKQALGIVGQKVSDWFKGAIDAGVPPPNRPSTVAAKHGSDHPLVDTGQLRNSIDYEVKDKGDK